jgi:hypothetical protein
VELQLLAVLLLVLQLALVDRDCRVQFGDAAVELAVLVLEAGEGLVQVGLLAHEAADVVLRLVALLADGVALGADASVLAPALLHLLAHLPQLQSSAFLLHLPHVAQTLLFLEADTGLRGLVLLAVLVGNELLGGELGFLEGLRPKS